MAPPAPSPSKPTPSATASTTPTAQSPAIASPAASPTTIGQPWLTTSSLPPGAFAWRRGVPVTAIIPRVGHHGLDDNGHARPLHVVDGARERQGAGGVQEAKRQRQRWFGATTGDVTRGVAKTQRKNNSDDRSWRSGLAAQLGEGYRVTGSTCQKGTSVKSGVVPSPHTPDRGLVIPFS